MRKLSSVFIDIFTHSAATCLYFHLLNVCPASSPCMLSTRSVQTCSSTSAQPSAPQVRVLLRLKASFCDISGVYRDTDKFVSIWITTPCWWLCSSPQRILNQSFYSCLKTKPSIFRVSKVIGQLTDWQFSHVYDNRSRYTQTKDQRCDKHTKPRFDSTGLTGGEKQPMIWRKPRHVTNMVEPVLQCRWIMTQKTST